MFALKFLVGSRDRVLKAGNFTFCVLSLQLCKFLRVIYLCIQYLLGVYSPLKSFVSLFFMRKTSPTTRDLRDPFLPTTVPAFISCITYLVLKKALPSNAFYFKLILKPFIRSTFVNYIYPIEMFLRGRDSFSSIFVCQQHLMQNSPQSIFVDQMLE